MKHFQRVLAIGLFVGAGASVQAQSIVNGDFPVDLSGWTTQGPATGQISDPGPDSVPGVAWLNDAPGPVAFIQQTIPGLTPGQSYTINGFYKTKVIWASVGSFTATIDGTTKFANTETSAVTNWTPFSFGFTPAATSAVLRLNGQVGSDSDYVVDKIAIKSNATATPEPGSVALLVGMGLSGVGLLARRRKQAVPPH
jgi:hypothetical protein